MKARAPSPEGSAMRASAVSSNARLVVRPAARSPASASTVHMRPVYLERRALIAPLAHNILHAGEPRAAHRHLAVQRQLLPVPRESCRHSVRAMRCGPAAPARAALPALRARLAWRRRLWSLPDAAPAL